MFTPTSKRTIPVFPPLEKLFQELPKTQKLIFPISESTIKRTIKSINEKLSFNFTVKTLRHTFNQNLTEMEISDIIRAKWLGHAKPTTTKKVYTHITDSLEEQEITKVKNSLKD